MSVAKKRKQQRLRFCRALVRKYPPETDSNPSKIRGFRSFRDAKSGRRDILKEYQIRLYSLYRGSFSSHCRVRPAGNLRVEDWILKALLISALCLGLVASPISALTLRDIQVDGIYYHNAFNNNNAVRVLRVEASRILVQFLEGSRAREVDYVPLADLMTKSESDAEAAEDIGQTIGGAAIILCVLMGCMDDEEENTDDASDAHLAEMRRVLGKDCQDLYWKWRNSAKTGYYSSFAYSEKVCAYSLNEASKAAADREALKSCGPTCTHVAWSYNPK